MTKQTSNKFSPEVRERAVRMVFDHQTEHGSQWATITSIASKIGCNPETLRSWVRQAERDEGKRPGLTTDERERIKAFEREVRELRQAKLSELRLPAIKLMWAKFAEQADKEGWPAARFLAALAEHEIADRSRRRIERHLAEARLPVGKTLSSFDFEAVPMVSKAQVMALTAGDSWLESRLAQRDPGRCRLSPQWLG